MKNRTGYLVLFAAVFSLTVGTLLSGCGGSGAQKPDDMAQTETEQEESGGEASAEETSGKEGLDASNLGKAAMKIALVTTSGNTAMCDYDAAADDGAELFIKDNKDSTLTLVTEETGDAAACVEKAREAAADHSVVICSGPLFSGIGSIAADYPDVRFILAGAFPTDGSGEEVECENVYALKFKVEEAGFLAGAAAALETETGKVAALGQSADTYTMDHVFGFVSGVNYANKHLGTAAEVVSLPDYAYENESGANEGGNFSGGEGGEEADATAAAALYGDGVDIIFAASPASAAGIVKAAAETETGKVIASDSDKYDAGAAGERNVVLTSVLCRLDRVVMKRLVDVSMESFEGKNELIGADTNATGYVFKEGRHQLKPETVTALDELAGKLSSGEIVPASTVSGTGSDSFTGL